MPVVVTALELQNVSKRFGDTVAVNDVTLSVAAGELFFLLGPSGCGKSTLLRLIAGLLEPTTGRIVLNGRDVTSLGTDERNAVMCFQNYALWPHMTIRDNVAFGPAARGRSKDEQRRRTDDVLALVQMTALAERKPQELSGGEQQRVALARALAVDPACLLLDEPLSNLDAKLRQEMRVEIRRIVKAAGTTAICVTHDQAEALSIGDRIALLRRGHVEQIGTPSELYNRPRTSFVADFIGQANVLPGTVVAREGAMIVVDTAAGRVRAVREGDGPSQVTLSIRPESMTVAAASDPAAPATVPRNRLAGRHVATTFLGAATEHVIAANGQSLRVVSVPPRFDLPADVTVEFAPDAVVVLTE